MTLFFLYSAAAKGTVYHAACSEKAERMSQKDPWQKTRRKIGYALIVAGWALFAMAVYQAAQFDYELANFDPYDILQVRKERKEIFWNSLPFLDQ